MSTPDPDPTLTDDLQAALAEIESMSREEAAAIPSLDDGFEDEGDSSAEGTDADARQAIPDALPDELDDQPSDTEQRIDDALAQLEAAAAEIGADSAAEPADLAPPAAPDDAGESAPQTKVDAPPVTTTEPSPEAPPERDELQAALEEVETIAATPNALASEFGSAQGSGPPDAHEPQRAKQPSKTPTAATAPEVKGSTATKPTKRFKIGTSAPDEDVAEYEPPVEDGGGETTPGDIQPIMPLSKRFYRATDRVLEAINQPFAGLSDSVRDLIGLVALTTVIISILAMVLMPIVLPHRDAVSYLEERRAALDAPPPPPTPAEADDSES